MTFSKHLWESKGVKCWHPPFLVRWTTSALTERSFPAHLHSSLLVGDAGQGICNRDKTVSVYEARKSCLWVRVLMSVSTAAAFVRTYARVEEVAIWFVIHFVSVYFIIHPGVQRASNSPDTACDRVQTAVGLKYAWGTFVWKQNRRSRDTWAPPGWRYTLKVGQKESYVWERNKTQTDWWSNQTLVCTCE